MRSERCGFWQPLCIRVCFVLGNLTVSNEEHRLTIVHDCDGCDSTSCYDKQLRCFNVHSINVLLGLLRRSLERDVKLDRLLKAGGKPKKDGEAATDGKDGFVFAAALIRSS